MIPSNANTSGLMQDLCERLDAILVEESPMHPFGCSTWEEASRVAIDMAKEVIVTAASAQARIAELSVSMTQQSDQWSERLLVMADRATAAEARADRLAKALGEALKTADWVIDFKGSSGSDRDLARMISEPIRRVALQQETQP